MKLMWFHLMPYTELPDDFREKNPSVWVDIHSSLFDPRRAHHMYNDFMDELEFAAECGFDAVCVNEHHNNGYGLMPSPNLIASSLARRTTDTALCVLGNSLALYNPPTRVAEEFAMIDVISGGRLIAGFPVGSPMDTCFAYGQNPSMLRERYLEAHDLVVKAWTEPETFAFNGRYNQQRYVNIWPRPVQKPRPPIWIPGGGSVETWRWCAQMDHVYCYLSYYGYKAGQATMDGFWAEMDRLGKDRNPYHAGFLQFVGVAETREEAYELYREPAEYFYGRCLHIDPRFAGPPGYTTEETQRRGIQGQVQQAAAARRQRYETKFATLAREMDAIVDKGYVIIGSPDEVAEQLREVAHNLNVGHLMLLLQFGNMNKDLAKYNTRLFAEKVMPQLKDVFSEWEDRWWPQPMAQANAPRCRRSSRRQWRRSRARATNSPPPPARERVTVPQRGRDGSQHRPACAASPTLSRGGGEGLRARVRMAEPETSFVEINGFSCRVWKKGRGPKLGFLAGFGGLPRWIPFLDALAEQRTVIVPSLPGFPGGERGHTVLDSHLDWVLATRQLLRKAGLDGADLAGSSVGGSLAAEDRGDLAGRRSSGWR